MTMDSSGSEAMAMGGSSTALWVTLCCCLVLRRWPRWFLPESSLYLAIWRPTQRLARKNRANRKPSVTKEEINQCPIWKAYSATIPLETAHPEGCKQTKLVHGL